MATKAPTAAPAEATILSPAVLPPTTPEDGASVGSRELDLSEPTFDFVEVPIPYGMDEYKCPSCNQSIPTRKQINLSKPARFAHVLNDVMKCPHCSFIFSYKTSTVRVLKS